MSDKDRIRLGEAMGLDVVAIRNDGGGNVRVSVRWPGAEHGVNFDPFTDANDDYAVLEWFRAWAKKKPAWMYSMFVEEVYKLGGESFIGYKIGGYARAVLKVLDTWCGYTDD